MRFPYLVNHAPGRLDNRSDDSTRCRLVRAVTIVGGRALCSGEMTPASDGGRTQRSTDRSGVGVISPDHRTRTHLVVVPALALLRSQLPDGLCCSLNSWVSAKCAQASLFFIGHAGRCAVWLPSPVFSCIDWSP
jgi:hypothetical protein